MMPNVCPCVREVLQSKAHCKLFSKSTALRRLPKPTSLPTTGKKACFPQQKNRSFFKLHKTIFNSYRTNSNFSPRIFIFYTTNFIFSLRNWKYNKGIFRQHKAVSRLLYCASRQNKEKNGNFSAFFWKLSPFDGQKRNNLSERNEEEWSKRSFPLLERENAMSTKANKSRLSEFYFLSSGNPSKNLCGITFLQSVYRSEPTVRRESHGPLIRKPEAELTWHGDFRIQPSHRPLRERGEHIVRSGETSNQRKIHGSGNSSGFVPTRSASPCLPVPTQRVH